MLNIISKIRCLGATNSSLNSVSCGDRNGYQRASHTAAALLEVVLRIDKSLAGNTDLLEKPQLTLVLDPRVLINDRTAGEEDTSALWENTSGIFSLL